MYSMEKNRIVFGDGLKLIKEIPSNSIHLILSDIPYGIDFADWDVLHNNSNSALGGTSPAQKSAGSAFRRRGKPINGWSDADKKIPLEYQQWVASWAQDWHRVLVDGASCFVFARRRFAHRVIVACQRTHDLRLTPLKSGLAVQENRGYNDGTSSSPVRVRAVD